MEFSSARGRPLSGREIGPDDLPRNGLPDPQGIWGRLPALRQRRPTQMDEPAAAGPHHPLPDLTPLGRLLRGGRGGRPSPAGPVSTPLDARSRPLAAEATAEPASGQIDAVTAEPRRAFPLRFHLGQLTATPEAVAAAHAAGIDVVAAVLRHLRRLGRRGPSPQRRQRRRPGHGRSPPFRLPPSRRRDALVVTTNPERSLTTATLASQHRAGH
jgi:hypothetical protein